MLGTKLLQRYILTELARVFALALVAITGIFVLALVVHEASQQGLGPEHVAALVVLLVPGTLPFTVPATTLFAVSVVYGRMAHDNEVTAVKAAGIPVSFVVTPAILLSVLCSVAIFGLYMEFIPHSHNQLRSTAWTDIEELIYARLRHTHCFNEPKVNYAITVREVQGRTLIGPIFKKREADGKGEMIAVAEEAELYVDLDRKEVLVRMVHGEVIREGGVGVSFLKEDIVVPLPPMNQQRTVRARERSNSEILDRMVEVRAEIEKTKRELDEVRRLPSSNDPPVSLETQTRFRLTSQQRELAELAVERAMRPAMAAGCFFFSLIGCPVAIWFHRRDYLSNFVTCFLPIVLLYYPLLMLAMNLGKEGKLDPMWGLWIGNAVLGVLGLGLWWRLSR